MAEEKKPGFFKRLFGFGKGAEPTPEPAPPPPPIVETPPIHDEAAERIAAEIAEAKRAAEAAALERAASEKAVAERKAAAEADRQLEERRSEERLEAQRAETARQKAAKLEAARLDAERAEAARKAEAERMAAEKQAEAERAEAARAEADRLEAAKAEAARVESARIEAERAAAVKAARRAEDERLAREKAEQEKAEREKAEAERLAAERSAAEQAEAAKAEAARIDAERLEAERLAAETARKMEEERLLSERLAAERLADERAIAEQAAAERAEAERRASEAAADPAPVEAAPKASWWQKLKSGLSRTASNVSTGITGLFTKRKLDDETLEELEDLLIQADLGIDVAARISAAVGKGRYDKEIEPDEVKAILAEEVSKVLKPVALPLVVTPKKPFVLLMVGVNGSGKTTTIGKLASKFRAEGKSVMLAAGDTFRAAAIEQLRVWGERTGAPVIARDQGGDAAGLAFDAVKEAQAKGADVLLIDTAGRLQNRTELMAELEKVIRVIKKLDETAPHATLLVLDATVGQNAISQVDIFGKQAGVTGLVMTKLDGTARGGILVALAERFKLPIHFIGVGEGVDDLEPFEATDFARAIAGLEQLGR